MEQVDELLINDLRAFGCQIPEDVKTAKDFSANLFTSALLRCIRLIDRERDLPRSIATARAQRVNQATQIVKALQELGYTEDLSYHNLLYPNELDTRKVFGWLVPKVPVKESPNESSSLFSQRLEEEMAYLNNSRTLWLPPFIQASVDSERGLNFYSHHGQAARPLFTPASTVFYPGGRRLLPEQKQYFSESLPLTTAQPLSRDAVPASVLEYNSSLAAEAAERDNEWNTVGITSGLTPQQFQKEKEKKTLAYMAESIRAALNAAKKKSGDLDDFLKNFGPKLDDSQMQRAAKFQKDQSESAVEEETEEALAERRAAERAKADEALLVLEEKLLGMEQNIQMGATEVLQMKAALQKEIDRTEQLKKDYLELKTTLDLVENAEENMKKLRDFAEKNKEKLLKFAEDWEKMRAPMVEEYRTLKENYSKREEEIKVKLEQIKQMRSEMKLLSTSMAEKEEKLANLIEVLKKMPKSENRNSYTSKILVLVGGVKKQKVEIAKILADTRSVQKETNTITDTLNRTFAVVEEMLFQDTKKDDKKDPSVAEAYKLLARLNKIFQELTDELAKAGAATNATIALEERTEKLEQRTTIQNSERIAEDLRQVKEENARLVAEYQTTKTKTGGGEKKKKKEKADE